MKTVEEYLRKAGSKHQREARQSSCQLTREASVHEATGTTPASMVFGRERLLRHILFGLFPTTE
jgi:hypothetical protein